MKKIFYLLLLTTTFANAQKTTGVTKLKIDQNPEKTTATRVLVQDATTKEVGYVAKTDLTIQDATTTTKGKIKLAGDLGGTADAPTVPALTTKVDKENGKGLSTNDYTTADKNKLSGIEAGAEVNVNADWNATSGDAQILNKPTIPSVSGLATETYVDNVFASKEPLISTGLDSQYWRGDKTWQTLPTYTLAGLGGVPSTRTITINGVSQDLTENREWNISGDSYWTSGSAGLFSVKATNDSSIDATGKYDHAEGFATKATGGFGAHAEGNGTESSGLMAHSEGLATKATGFASHAENESTEANGAASHSGGYGTQANGRFSFVHGQSSQANGNNTIVLGKSIIGNEDDTTYVDKFNIKTLGTATSVNNLGIDVDGNVVVGSVSTGSSVNLDPLEFNVSNKTVWNNGKGNIESNTSFGQGALGSNYDGEYNVAIGPYAINSPSSNRNTVIGYEAMADSAGTNHNDGVFMGYRARGGYYTTNQIVIGSNAYGAGSNTATLGNTLILKTILRGTINTAGLAVYADNATATAGGLVVGDIYRTSTGELKIVY
jgi:hypothetical protein